MEEKIMEDIVMQIAKLLVTLDGEENISAISEEARDMAIRANQTMKPTGAKPRKVGDVIFRCYRVGFPFKYYWMSDDMMTIEMRKENVFVAWRGKPCPKNSMGRTFRTFETAAKALMANLYD